MPDVVQRADVRMIERRDRARLAVEPLAQLRIGRERSRQHLDGDGPLKPRVSCAIDLAHPAGADWGNDLVRAEPKSRVESHGPWGIVAEQTQKSRRGHSTGAGSWSF